MGDIAFVVRALPSTGLKGAFRVHISPECLTQLGLKVGELCTITSEDGIKGGAIAWRALDKMGGNPKQQSAKMSETLRDAWGFKQGSQVRIEKATSPSIMPAKRISLIEIGPAHEVPYDNVWNTRCRSTFVGVEGVSVGTSFDVNAEGGLKRRYCVEQIEFDSVHDAPLLARLDDDTELQILDEPPRSPTANVSTQQPLQIDAHGIGGLHEQIRELNNRLSRLCCQAKSLNGLRDLPWNRGVLIHGYEGTGKSLLLNALASVTGLRKVLHLDQTQLLGTPSKNQAYIKNLFHEAVMAQPSLLLMDDLDHAAPQADASTASTTSNLAHALDDLCGTQVLVVATARSPNSLHSSLLAPGRLERFVELPVPSVHGRRQILRALLGEGIEGVNEIIDLVADRTHGFTGADLRRLVSSAHDEVYGRLVEGCEDWLNVDVPVRRSSIDDDAATLVEKPQNTTCAIYLQDFDKALQEVKPSALREIIVEPPKITFDDIGGSFALQARFDEIIKRPIEHPEIYASIPDLTPPRGVLLYGPPGCSKTMTAQAVASTYGWNFIAIKGAELISMYVGESERAIRDIFRKAKQAAPAIIFFDEIDSIATARAGSADASKSLNVLTTLLNEMDGFETAKNVLVLAATNKPESLDPAILRPGRFDEHVYLGPPSAEARKEILRICTRNAPADGLMLDEAVEKTEGMSGAEIRHAWKAACNIAVGRSFTVGKELKITTDDLLTSVGQTRRGITKAMLRAYEDFAGRDYGV